MKIERTVNGYLITITERDEEGNKYKERIVIQEREDYKDFDPEAVIALLNIILENLGVFVSNRKYEKENIDIDLKHGTHYECTGCSMCENV